MFWGIIFIVIGVAWLLQSLGFIPESVNWFWPAILIAIGISILFGDNKKIGKKVNNDE